MFRYMFRYLMKFIIIIISFLCTSRSLPLAKRLSLLAECLAKRLSLLAECHTGRGKGEAKERQGSPKGTDQRRLTLKVPAQCLVAFLLCYLIFSNIIKMSSIL